MALTWIAGVAAGGGCQQAARAPAMQPNMALHLPMPVVAVQRPEIRRTPPDLRVDPRWLELDGFFPPGAQRVGPALRVALDLAPERRTRFPSTELCTSPDERSVLFHDGMKRKQRGIVHWLMLLKHDAPFPNSIFLTNLAFDTSWSEDSRRFAVTHFVGDNSSEVFVVDVEDLVRKPIDLRPCLEEFFPPHLVAVPMFVKAHRWSRDGQLVVRGVGRAREEPYELVGCEVAVTFAGPEATPVVRFLRGYTKPQEAP